MRVLFIGDVVGSMGREMITEYLPRLKKKYRPQVTIVNGENAASGRGITEKIYKKFLQDGVDVVTMGNHTWDNRGIFEFVNEAKKMVRPANFPEGTPGQGMVFVKVNQVELAVINMQARSFMVDLDDPFRKMNELVEEARKRTPIIFVDFHGETTSEKQAMGWFLDGKVSAVVGTHTHVQTNDARILPRGTAYLTDVGMTGPYDGILGMRREPVIEKFLTALPKRFEVVEQGRSILSGCILELDDTTGHAKEIQLIQINDDRPLWSRKRGSFLQQEPEIQKEARKLTKLLRENETIIRYKELEEKIQQNQYLAELREKIKQAQKDAVHFATISKPAAEQEAIKQADQFMKEFDQHPLVVAYRKQLLEADDLLHHLTTMIQEEINGQIEEEKHASKN